MKSQEQMVLVVDDDEPARKVLTRQLKAIGYETMDVDSGESALEMLAAGRFAAALVDLHMPGIDGHETLAGEAIPLGARILSVADAFDAMTSDRPCCCPRHTPREHAWWRSGCGK